MNSNHLVNPDAIAMAIAALGTLHLTKQAFVPAGDPSMDPSAGGGAAPPGGGPPGGDPSQGGGDPSQGGGSPPPPPPPDATAIAQQVMQMIQAQGGMGGGGGGGGMEPIKPKIDVNVTLLQLLKIVSKIADGLGIQIPASEMVATQNDLTNFGMQQQQGAGAGGAGAGGAGAGGGASSIAPIAPIQPAAPGMGAKSGAAINDGTAFDTSGLEANVNRAQAIANFRKAAVERRNVA